MNQSKQDQQHRKVVIGALKLAQSSLENINEEIKVVNEASDTWCECRNFIESSSQSPRTQKNFKNFTNKLRAEVDVKVSNVEEKLDKVRRMLELIS